MVMMHGKVQTKGGFLGRFEEKEEEEREKEEACNVGF